MPDPAIPAIPPFPIRIGINYTLNSGWDFGSTIYNRVEPEWIREDLHADDHRRAFWRRLVERDFERFARLGLSVVRMPILGSSGRGYPRYYLYTNRAPAGVPRYDSPYTFSGRGEALHITSPPREPTPDVLGDFKFVLRQAQRNNLRLIPVLTSFEWCFAGVHQAGRDAQTPLIDRGRWLMLTQHRGEFLSRTIEPLLAAATSVDPSLILAWDIMNEPDWGTDANMGTTGGSFWRDLGRTIGPRAERVRQQLGFGMSVQPKVSLPDMLSYLTAAMALIARHRYRSTIGFASYGTVEAWNQSAFTTTLRTAQRNQQYTHQFHYYGESDLPFGPRGGIGEANGTGFSNTFIGEYAPRAYPDHPDWPDMEDPISNRRFPDSTYWRLRWFRDRGYGLALAWPTEATRPRDDYTGRLRTREDRSLLTANRPIPNGSLVWYSKVRLVDQCLMCQYAHGDRTCAQRGQLCSLGRDVAPARLGRPE